MQCNYPRYVPKNVPNVEYAVAFEVVCKMDIFMFDKFAVLGISIT